MLTVLRGRTMIDVNDAAIAGVGLAVLYPDRSDYSACRRWIRKWFLLWPDTPCEKYVVPVLAGLLRDLDKDGKPLRIEPLRQRIGRCLAGATGVIVAEHEHGGHRRRRCPRCSKPAVRAAQTGTLKRIEADSA